MKFWKLGSSRIASLRDSERGRDCFVLGNAPSITQHRLSGLQGKLSIGVNASTKLEKEHGFVSKYYVVSDRRFLENPEKRHLACDMLNPSTIRVFREELKPVDEPSLAERTCYVRALGKNGFSDDLSRGFYFGCTTVMLAIQLAAHLGCERIFLLGADFNYSPAQPRFYAETNADAPDPFLSVQLWNVWNAAVELKRRSRKLYICSEESRLTPYVDYIGFDDAVRGELIEP